MFSDKVLLPVRLQGRQHVRRSVGVRGACEGGGVGVGVREWLRVEVHLRLSLVCDRKMCVDGGVCGRERKINREKEK